MIEIQSYIRSSTLHVGFFVDLLIESVSHRLKVTLRHVESIHVIGSIWEAVVDHNGLLVLQGFQSNPQADPSQ